MVSISLQNNAYSWGILFDNLAHFKMIGLGE